MAKPEDKRRAAAHQVARVYLEDNAMWLDPAIAYEMYQDCLVDALRKAQHCKLEQLLAEASAGERYAHTALLRAANEFRKAGKLELSPQALAAYAVAVANEEGPTLRPGRAKFEASLRDLHISRAVDLVKKRHVFSQRRSAVIVCKVLNELKLGPISESGVLSIARRA